MGRVCRLLRWGASAEEGPALPPGPVAERAEPLPGPPLHSLPLVRGRVNHAEEAEGLAASRSPRALDHGGVEGQHCAARGRPAPGAGGRRGGWDPARKRRVVIAEENYKLRLNWSVPCTVAVRAQECVRSPQQRRGVVSFSGWTSAEAVMRLAELRRLGPGTICVLNFANGESNHVGGGYKTGALAQEEDLCRRMPNLYTSLFQAQRHGLYPFGPSTYRGPSHPGLYSDVLFTPDVAIARWGEAEDFQLLPPGSEVMASVVSAAAPNVAFGGEVVVQELLVDAIRNIFLAPKAKQPSLSVLILGAWGCGAFGGDPKLVSELFAGVLAHEGLGALYDEVHFAIPQGWGDKNAVTFRASLQAANLGLVELP